MAEYNRLKLENDLLKCCSDAVNKQYDELRSKIDKAIEEIEKRSFDNEPFIIRECLKTYRDEVVEILKRNIGEEK